MRGIRSNLVIFALCGLAWITIVVNSTIHAHENPHNGRTPVASERAIADFARATLDPIQRRSFAEEREFCGLILEDDTGRLDVSLVLAGRESECDLPWVSPMGLYPVATFHTHGAFNQRYDSEVPSALDLQTDIREQIDGFIATPGGRLWRNDWQGETTSLVCGEGCLPRDPRYRTEPDDSIAPRYTLHQLKQRQN